MITFGRSQHLFPQIASNRPDNSPTKPNLLPSGQPPSKGPIVYFGTEEEDKFVPLPGTLRRNQQVRRSAGVYYNPDYVPLPSLEEEKEKAHHQRRQEQDPVKIPKQDRSHGGYRYIEYGEEEHHRRKDRRSRSPESRESRQRRADPRSKHDGSGSDDKRPLTKEETAKVVAYLKAKHDRHCTVTIEGNQVVVKDSHGKLVDSKRLETRKETQSRGH